MTKISQRTPFPLRMPDDVRERIEELSRANGRSVNAEIVSILSAAMGDTTGLAALPVEVLLMEAAARFRGKVEINVITPSAPAKRATRTPAE